MVLEEDGTPAVIGRDLLAGRQRLLDIRQLKRLYHAPVIAADQVIEREDHVENAVASHPIRQVVGADTVGLPNGEDVRAVLDLLPELVQEIQYARGIDRHGMDA